MAAAAAAWKANLEQRAVSVDDNTKYALGHLVAAFIHLEHRIDTAAAAEGAARDQIEAALESLVLAAGAASLASAQILAAEVIGLRGASTNPARPLGLIEEIPDTSIRSGLLALKAAYPIADELFHQLKVGKAHLSAMCYLLGADLGVEELVDLERGLAEDSLKLALQNLFSLCTHASSAKELLSGN